MNALTSSDQRKITEFARQLYGAKSLETVAKSAVQSLHALIDVNSALITRIDAPSGALITLADTVGPELIHYYEPASALKHEHPGFRHVCNHPNGGATALADVVSLQQWKRTGIYNEVCSKVGMHEQLSAQVPFGQPDYLDLVVNRSRRNFTSRDHLVLNILRHHVAEAFRTASASPSLPTLPLLEALESVVGGSLIALDLLGAVQFSSRLAQRQLQAFFPEELPFQGSLPATLRQWIKEQISAFSSDGLALLPRRPLTIQRGEDSLQLYLGSNRDGTAHVLALREKGPAYDMDKLRKVGLGRRPTEVLYWLGQEQRGNRDYRRDGDSDCKMSFENHFCATRR